jgi:hypothetical protein
MTVEMAEVQWTNPYKRRPKWMDTPIPEWVPQDFFFYGIYKYNDYNKVGKHPNIPDRVKQQYYRDIRDTVELRGNSLLKSMIDWVYDHAEEHPEWDYLFLDLVLGTSETAEYIAGEASNNSKFRFVICEEDEDL